MRLSPDSEHYDAWQDAINEERNLRARDRCQCAHLDMPGRCPGPWACPLVEQDDDEE